MNNLNIKSGFKFLCVAFLSTLICCVLSLPFGFAETPVKQTPHYQKLYLQGKIKQAVFALSEYLSQNPDDVTARYYLANSYMALSKWYYARQVLNQLVLSAPQTNEGRLALVALGRINAWERQNYPNWKPLVVEGAEENAEDSDIDTKIGKAVSPLLNNTLLNNK